VRSKTGDGLLVRVVNPSGRAGTSVRVVVLSELLERTEHRRLSSKRRESQGGKDEINIEE